MKASAAQVRQGPDIRMVLLQNKLNLRVTQKQILTPGLVQMVSVLALNKLELREMINTEMVENPVLEELDSSVPLLDQVAGREEARDREVAQGYGWRTGRSPASCCAPRPLPDPAPDPFGPGSAPSGEFSLPAAAACM